MSVDFTKFPFQSIEHPHATTLTEAIRAEPVASGFIVIAVKVVDTDDFAGAARTFAQAARASAASTGLTDISAYRSIRPDEIGGAVPFDQAICESIVNDAEQRVATQSEKFPGLKLGIQTAKKNENIDWVLLAEFETPDQAMAAASGWGEGDEHWKALTDSTSSHTVGAFKNRMRYSSVSRDPNVIHFFNFFPGPGDGDALWASWLQALPRFLEAAEFRSSFGLVALDPSHSTLLINVAHMDSMKHWLLGILYDPNNVETVSRCYVERGFSVPTPFFCKIMPV